MYGPTGVGACMERRYLNEIPPYQGGRNDKVSFEKQLFSSHKFEAGTPNIAVLLSLQLSLSLV